MKDDDPGKHLAFACGYAALGMVGDAEREWRQVAADLRDRPAGLAVGVEIARQRRQWWRMARLARRLQAECPEEPDGWLVLSYALRRGESLRAAKRALLRAETQHGDHPIVQYNLACYAAQLGEDDEAVARLERASARDRDLLVAAKTDPDFEPVRSRVEELARSRSEGEAEPF